MATASGVMWLKNSMKSERKSRMGSADQAVRSAIC